MLIKNFSKVLIVILICFVTAISHAQNEILIDFENGNLDDWEVIDEAPKNLGDAGPSSWEVKKGGPKGVEGKSLTQGSNIWGSAGDTCLMGTFIIYKKQKFIDFELDIDVVSADNDGMGIAWAFESTKKHYRMMMINDGWPEVPVDKVKGPFMKIQKRVSDDEPWYELLEAEKGITYSEGAPLHWKLTVKEGVFKFRREDGKTIEAKDDEYQEGYIGIQLYAQQAYFDNLKIVNTYPVDPKHKMPSTWGQLKKDRL